MQRLLGAAIAACALTWATAASAVGLASFTTTDQFVWDQSAAKTGGSLSGFGNATFQYYPGTPDIPRSLYSRSLPATFVLTASLADGNPAACCYGGAHVQHKVVYDFAFIYTGLDPLVVGDQTLTTGANLFSGTGIRGSMSALPSGGALFGFSTGGTYSSDLLDYSYFRSKAANLNFTMPIPAFTAPPGESVGDFWAYNTRGVFFASVPEPATWAMMLIGFGIGGAALRRARRASSSVRAGC